MLKHAWDVQVRSGLGHIDPYFDKLADAMVTWIEAWRMCNPGKGAAEDEAAASPAADSSKASSAQPTPKGSNSIVGKLANGVAKR